MSWASLCRRHNHNHNQKRPDLSQRLTTVYQSIVENIDTISTIILPTNLHPIDQVLASTNNNRQFEKSSKSTSSKQHQASSLPKANFLVTLLIVLLTFFISASMASPIIDVKQSSNLGDMLLKSRDPAAEITSASLIFRQNQLHRHHRLHKRSADAAAAVNNINNNNNAAKPSPVCLVQFVERRSCRPISTPTDWETDVVDDSSASVEATDTAELRYHEIGYNAPSLRLTAYNKDPHDESTYFIERPVPGKPGVFTLQTLSTREFICVSRRGRLRLQQAPVVKRRCWWMAGKMAFGTYGQQRHSMALISARHYPNLANATLITHSASANHNSTFSHHRQIPNYQQLQIKLSSPGSLTNHWVVGFRRDGRPLPSYAPKVLNLDKMELQNDQQSKTADLNYHHHHHQQENLAFDTFLFSRLVASSDDHDNHGFSTASCHEALQRHNNYARHLTFC